MPGRNGNLLKRGVNPARTGKDHQCGGALADPAPPVAPVGMYCANRKLTWQIKFARAAVFTPTCEIQIVISHLLSLLAAWFPPERALLLLFNVPVITGDRSYILLRRTLLPVVLFIWEFAF